MSKFKEIKETLKAIASKIRETRKEHKVSMREKGVGLDCKLNSLKSEFRCLHIARCLSSGTPYEKIEKPSERHQLKPWDLKFIQLTVEELKNERNASSVLQN